MVVTKLKPISAMILVTILASCTPFKPSGDISDIRGRVFSKYYNGPVQNAKISIPSLSTVVKTDINGYFELRGMPTKWLKAKVSHATHAELKREVHVEPFGSKYVEFWLDKTSNPKVQPEVVFERNFDIWITDEYGMNQKNITGRLPRYLYRTNPVWSHDKKKIGFISYDSSQRMSTDDGVWSMRADGTMPRKLASVMDVGRLYHLDWNRSGKQFLFMLQNRMFVFNKKSGQLKGLNSQLSRTGTFNNYALNSGPVWTPDNQHIVYSDTAVDLNRNYAFSPLERQVFMMDADGSHRRQLTFGGDHYAPAVSHDGNTIAYVSTKSGAAEVWVMDLDGSNPQQITRLNSTQMSQPRWSSDDQRLIFSTNYMQKYRSTQPKELWAIGRDGSGLRMITNDAIHADG